MHKILSLIMAMSNWYMCFIFCWKIVQ